MKYVAGLIGFFPFWSEAEDLLRRARGMIECHIDGWASRGRLFSCGAVCCCLCQKRGRVGQSRVTKPVPGRTRGMTRDRGGFMLKARDYCHAARSFVQCKAVLDGASEIHSLKFHIARISPEMSSRQTFPKQPGMNSAQPIIHGSCLL